MPSHRLRTMLLWYIQEFTNFTCRNSIQMYESDIQWKCKHTWYLFTRKIHKWHLCKTVMMFTCAQKNTSHQKRQNSTARNSNNYVKIQWARKPNSGTERWLQDRPEGGRQTGSAFQRSTGKICNKLRLLTIQKCCNSTPKRSKASRESSGALQGSSEVLRSCPYYCSLDPHTVSWSTTPRDLVTTS